MPTTRAAEKAAATKGDDSKSEDKVTGSKHETKHAKSPQAKRLKKNDDEKQQTIEDTIPSSTREASESKEEPKPSAGEKNTAQDQIEKTDAAEKPGARQNVVPSSILEKGIIYFFFRGRVGIDEPSDVNEIQRSFMILRPLGKDAELGEGTIRDTGNIRLIAVPKKVFPRSGRDRWIAFVEKSDSSLKTIKEKFLSSSDYETKTVGTRHSPAATPAAEGVFAITTTGRESHLVYMITLPSKLGEVQTELGLREKGSFIISTRNPQYHAPRGVAFSKGADYPKEVLDEFRGLRWIPSHPHHLDYVNTQFLLIGESSGIKKATEPQKEDEKEGKEKPEDELETLEDEDAHRMEVLKDDDSRAIFADLGVLAKGYPELKTTFE
ncbi:hypothetical protein GQX73_g6498 [Xylaria multiplex]|uniref:BTB domain transcription factor n=1 Tax=Xylaria multiplex TaxID=323545 RepID=A0A7C8MN39_9PEZI|nr:hypothetical protein GQX73_g6498 [Xylaria multiplex]